MHCWLPMTQLMQHCREHDMALIDWTDYLPVEYWAGQHDWVAL